jgi:hypothetical protein
MFIYFRSLGQTGSTKQAEYDDSQYSALTSRGHPDTSLEIDSGEVLHHSGLPRYFSTGRERGVIPFWVFAIRRSSPDQSFLNTAHLVDRIAELCILVPGTTPSRLSFNHGSQRHL